MQDNLTDDQNLPDIPDNNFFEFIVSTTKKTVRQEDALIRQILYTGFSAFTDDPINLGIMAPTSEGKTYPIMETFQFFPNEIVWNIGKMSKMVLVRQKGILVDSNNEPIAPRVLELKQKISIEKDDSNVVGLKEELSNLYSDSRQLIDLNGKILVFLEPPEAELWDLIKPILSHDNEEISFDYVDTDKPKGVEGSKVQKVIVRGWPTFIYCSAKDESNWSTWPEIQSRFLITSPNMTKEKYEESNLLIAQKKGLPPFIQDQVIVSEHDIKSSKQCANYIIQQLKSIQGNNVWIPYHQILVEALKADKGTDVRNTKRIFSFLNIIPLVKSDTRQKLSLNGNTSIIATLEDLSEVLAITQNLNGLPAFKMIFFRCVFLSLFNSKTEPDRSDDGTKQETEIAVNTKELREYYKSKFGKIITTDNLKKTYLNELHNNGIIEEEESKVDGRQKIYKPLISFDDEKISNYTNLPQFDNLLQHSPILLPNNYKLPDENWLIMEILTFLKYRIDKTSNELIQLEDIQILNSYGTRVSIKEFVSKYEHHVSLIRYFKKTNYRNYHSKIFGDIKYINGQGKKDAKNYRIDSDSCNSIFFEPLNTNANVETNTNTNTETDEYSNLNLEEMKFEPLSNILKKEIPVSNTGLKPVEGVSHICPDCNQLVYSDEKSRNQHKEKCSAKVL